MSFSFRHFPKETCASIANKTLAVCLVFAFTFLPGACAWLDTEETGLDSEQLYQLAKGSLLGENYTDATTKYEELETKHPFHKNSRDALLEMAYAYYKNSEPLLAEEKLEFFIKEYPDDHRIAYAYYLKGLANYNYATSIVYAIINFDRTDKDPQPLIDAFNAFNYLLVNYPDSKYTDSAHRHLIIIRNTLAVYEIKVANYYFQRKAYVATINRIQYLLQNYEGAQHTPNGLLLMAEAYRKVGRDRLAKDTARILELNFPEFVDQHIGDDGAVDVKADSDWFKGLKDISERFLELIDVKERY